METCECPNIWCPIHGPGRKTWMETRLINTSTNAEIVERTDVKVNSAAPLEDCEKALIALAGAGICTPAETYGKNSSWAISDLCRGVTTLAATISTLQGELAEMTKDRDLWQGDHNEDCPNRAEADSLLERVSEMAALLREFIGHVDSDHECYWCRDLKFRADALLAPKPVAPDQPAKEAM